MANPDGLTHPYAEPIARQFHQTYERLAGNYGYKTREASAVPWEAVPEANKALMLAVVTELLDRGVIMTGTPYNPGGTLR